MPLKLSLKPGETFVVNGAVIRNGERRGVLLLETQARILREKDLMRPEDATTPIARTYFAIMQMYLLGEVDGPSYDRAAEAIAGLMVHAESQDQRDTALEISADVTSGALYRALGRCRKAMTVPPNEAAA